MDNELEKAVTLLETILARQLAAHEELLALIGRKDQALRQARHQAVRELCRQENAQVQAISELEKQRIELAARITLMLDPSSSAPLRVLELAQRLEEPARGRLLVLRQQLRQKMERVRHEAGVVRRSAEALSRHMLGLVQSISGAVSGGGVYCRQGAPPRAAMTMSTFSATA